MTRPIPPDPAARPASPVDLGIVDGLVQLSTLVGTALAEAGAAHELPVLQMRLLGVLRDREPGMAELGRLLGLDKSSTTGLVDRAQRRGLVERVADPADGRAWRVVTTPAGRKLTTIGVAEVTRRVDTLTDALSAADRVALSRLASEVVVRAGVPAEPAPAAAFVDAPDADRRPRVAVIIGSTRPARISAPIAEWVCAQLQASSSLRYELLDLAAVDLPFLDEPLMGALGRYEHAHTRAWSETVSTYAGFVLVFPQYNWGYPAVLKNALDFLYREWAGKPVSYVTFGTRGGNRAAAQIDGVLAGLHMAQLADHLEVVITREDLDEAWQLRDRETLLAPYAEAADTIDAQMTEAIAQLTRTPSAA